jgi:type II secretory pathway component PulF
LEWSYFLQANWIPITLAFMIPIVILVAYIRTPKGAIWFDKWLIKMPIMGDLLHKTSIEILHGYSIPSTVDPVKMLMRSGFSRSLP